MSTLHFHFHALAPLQDRSYTLYGPVYRSCSSIPLLLLRWIVLPSLVVVSADGRLIFALPPHRDSTVSLCILSRACLTSRSISRRFCMKLSSSLLCSESSIRGTSVSRVVRGLRLDDSSKGDLLAASDVSGSVRFTQDAGDAHASQHSDQADRNSTAYPAPNHLVSPQFRGLEGGMLAPTECQLSSSGIDVG